MTIDYHGTVNGYTYHKCRCQKCIYALRTYRKSLYLKRRNDWFELNGPCVICGSWNELQVDHKDYRNKSFNIDWRESKIKLEKELAKCQVLCYDCHRKKTNSELTIRRSGRNNPRYVSIKIRHGTITGYQNKKCRCNICKEFWKNYQYNLRHGD